MPTPGCRIAQIQASYWKWQDLKVLAGAWGTNCGQKFVDSESPVGPVPRPQWRSWGVKEPPRRLSLSNSDVRARVAARQILTEVQCGVESVV